MKMLDSELRHTDQLALNAYLGMLREKGAGPSEVSKVKHFMRYVLAAMREKPNNGDSYRLAVDQTLRNFPEEEYFLGHARNFYAFLIEDQAAIARLRNHDAAAQTPDIVVQGDLKTMLKMLADDVLANTPLVVLERHVGQRRSLERYLEQLRIRDDAGVHGRDIQGRASLLNILLLLVRASEPSGEAYRNAVDSMLMLFPNVDRWHIFLSVAREFYYFWINDPLAHHRMQTPLGIVDLDAIAR